MEAVLFTNTEETRDLVEAQNLAEYLRPDVFLDGQEPEARAVYFDLSWERYLALDKALGDNRPGPRFYYLDHALEIMTTSNAHERIKTMIGGLMELYFDELDVDIVGRGNATMRLVHEGVGAEPDLSWCIGEEKEFPDLVLEIALSSGGIRKLDIYRWFKVPEVWFWKNGKLEVYALLADSSGYEQMESVSRLLPGLDVGLLERCVRMTNWREARQTFRAGLASS